MCEVCVVHVVSVSCVGVCCVCGLCAFVCLWLYVGTCGRGWSVWYVVCMCGVRVWYTCVCVGLST